MKLFLPGLFLVASSLLLAGVDEGKALYQKRCQMCHGADGAGNPKMAKVMKIDQFRHLGSAEVQKLSDKELLERIRKLHEKQKQVTQMKDEELQDVISFLRTFKK